MRRLAVVTIALVLQVSVHGKHSESICSTTRNPIVLLSRDESGGVTVLKTISTGVRALEDHVPSMHWDIEEISSSSFPRLLEDVNLRKTGDLFYARQCSCHAPTTYCPLLSTHCEVSTHDGEIQTLCMAQEQYGGLTRTLFFVVNAWFFFLLILLIFTNNGRSLVDFCISKAFPSWNHRVARRIETNDPIRAYNMVRNYLYRRRCILRRQLNLAQGGVELPAVVPQIKPPPTSMELKTRLYRENENYNDSCGCSICFMPLEVGERVGALPCQHTFHVDCLKLWLPRRNTCPLCQDENVATPRYEYNRIIVPSEEELENQLRQELNLHGNELELVEVATSESDESGVSYTQMDEAPHQS